MADKRALPPILLLLLLLLHIVSAASDGGVDAACKKAPDAGFCASLLQPYASELSEADGVKTGMAAVNATLERVDQLREFMVHEAVREQTTPEELQALSGCLSNVGNGEGSLKVALQTLNETRGAERAEVLKMIDGAATELNACVDSLKKHTHDDVVRKALTLTEESVQACSLAQAFLP